MPRHQWHSSPSVTEKAEDVKLIMCTSTQPLLMTYTHAFCFQTWISSVKQHKFVGGCSNNSTSALPLQPNLIQPSFFCLSMCSTDSKHSNNTNISDAGPQKIPNNAQVSCLATEMKFNCATVWWKWSMTPIWESAFHHCHRLKKRCYSCGDFSQQTDLRGVSVRTK